MKIEELKIKAFDIRNQIDQLEQERMKLIDEYNKIVIEISKFEYCSSKRNQEII